MAKRCTYIHPNGKPCRRWARHREKYCYHHTPDLEQQERISGDTLHPLLRLTSPEDIFDVVRETLNAVRLGRIRPGQAYAVGYLVDVWFRTRKELDFFQRDRGLYRQLLTEQVESEEIADEALADGSPVLPDPPPESGGKSRPPQQPQHEDLVSVLLSQLKKASRNTGGSVLKNVARPSPGHSSGNNGSKDARGQEN